MDGDGPRSPGRNSIACAILGYAHDIDDVQAVIDAATVLARHQVERGRVPPLYASGVRYRREQHATLPGVERVQSPEETHAMGAGDCDDLAPWRAAELQVAGEHARALVVHSPNIGYHVVVRREDGRIEDPSARLGMLKPTMGEESRTARRRRMASALLRRARELGTQAARAYDPRTKVALLREATRLAQRAKAGFAQDAREEDDEAEDELDELEGLDVGAVHRLPKGMELDRVVHTWLRPKG